MYTGHNMQKINPLIWEELKKIDNDDQTRNFVLELLTYERNHMNQERVRGYSDFYDKTVDKQVKRKG